MKIPYGYKTEDIDYLTLPPIKTFCKENSLGTNSNREDLLNQIEEFSEESDINEVKVKKWLDETLKIGIKTCLVSKVYFEQKINLSNIEKIIKKDFPNCPNSYVCIEEGGTEPKLVNYKIIHKNGLLERVEFSFLISLIKAKSTYSSSGMKINYPIFVDVDFNNGFIVSRGKSTSLLFKISEGLEINPKLSTKPEALIRDCMSKVMQTLKIKEEGVGTGKSIIKRTIFNILDKFTKTPDVIDKIIKKSETDNEKYVKEVFGKLGISTKGELYEDAKYDLRIFIEKYASITYPDKNIFITDRDAYPIKFNAQDNEFTKIQESTSGIDEPLQRKKAFFDSKKAVYTDKKCDKICLCYKALPQTYYNEKKYNVIITIYKEMFCIKFSRFVKEGDIQNVLSRIIQLYNVQN